MRQNISNDRLIETIVSKVKRMNDGDAMNVENELYYALDRIESTPRTGDDYDLGSNLYWLLDAKTQERLRSFDQVKCKYMPENFLCATVALKGYNEDVYTALVSNANPNISVEIYDPMSLQSIGEAYENLMNDVMNYYQELKDMQLTRMYLQSFHGLLKKKYPDVDWDHMTPRIMFEAIKTIK